MARTKRKQRSNELYAAAFVLIVLATTLVLGQIGVFGATGAATAVTVTHYGVSDYPLEDYEGKVQTHGRVYQPVLDDLYMAEVAAGIATDIVEDPSLSSGLVSVYMDNPPAQLSASYVDAVMEGADYASDHFTRDTMCIQNVGKIYGHRNAIRFVVVSDLVYDFCPTKFGWKVAKAEHSFYTTKGHKMCTQYSPGLFSVSRYTGETSTDIRGC